MEPAEFYRQTTERMIDALERGTAPWIRPWRKSGSGEREGLPVNAVTGRPYQGVNALSLSLHALSSGMDDMRFATFRQAQEKGWGIRRGARGLPVIKLVSRRRDSSRSSLGGGQGEETALEAISREGKGETEASERAPRPLFPLIPRIYHVFSSSDIVGLPSLADEGRSFESWGDLLDGTAHEEAGMFCCRLSEGLGVPVYHGGSRAFYDRDNDAITLPPEKNFKELEGYLGTLFHEFGHATGHEKRLNRIVDPWGESAYAFEELVAELASLFVGMRTGVSPDEAHFHNHASYVGHWIKTLRNDRRALFRASSLAQEACNLLLEVLGKDPGGGDGEADGVS
ncbi:MAG: ArdC family protein [Leptospirillia bacterium]